MKKAVLLGPLTSFRSFAFCQETGVKKLKECYQVEVEFNKQRIKDHKTFFNPRDPPRDYIDSILFAQTKTEILNSEQIIKHKLTSNRFNEKDIKIPYNGY